MKRLRMIVLIAIGLVLAACAHSFAGVAPNPIGPALDFALTDENGQAFQLRDLAAPRHVSGASGWHTVFRRSVPPPGMVKRSPVSYIGGYAFHIGLAIVVFFFAPHIKLIEGLLGISWPGLPSQIIDLVTVVTLAAMVVVLVDRIKKPVKRFLSTFQDWLTWTVTFLPVLTGWLAVQHLLLPYTTMLALHILSVEVLLVVLPFTKLFHAFTVFGSRWYNGAVNGHKEVPV